MNEGYPRGPQFGGYPKASNGVIILILGILSIAICGLLGPIAWVMGNQSMKDIRMGVMDPREEGLVNAGRIIGMIVTILICLGVVLYCGILVFAIGIGAAGSAVGPR
jgi:hypothetical protein